MAKIMVVDDKIELLEMYKDVLEFIKHKIVGLAKNGEEAVKKYLSLDENDIPDLILMDHRMPVKDGLQATKEILEQIKAKEGNYKKTKIVFASADESIKDQVQKLGIKVFLAKPFTIEQLVEVIEQNI